MMIRTQTTILRVDYESEVVQAPFDEEVSQITSSQATLHNEENISRWGILCQPFRFSVPECLLIYTVAMRLHNFVGEERLESLSSFECAFEKNQQRARIKRDESKQLIYEKNEEMSCAGEI